MRLGVEVWVDNDAFDIGDGGGMEDSFASSEFLERSRKFFPFEEDGLGEDIFEVRFFPLLLLGDLMEKRDRLFFLFCLESPLFILSSCSNFVLDHPETIDSSASSWNINKSFL